LNAFTEPGGIDFLMSLCPD